MLAILKSGKFWFGIFVGVVLMSFLSIFIMQTLFDNEAALAQVIKENKELANACVRAFFTN